MAKPNPARDYSSKLAEDAGFTVQYNYIYREWRALTLQIAAPQERAGFKDLCFHKLATLGFAPQYNEWYGQFLSGMLIIHCRLMNDKNPHAKPPKAKESKPNPLPESVAKYITGDLGMDLKDVVAHRIVNGNETLYAVLMRNGSGFMMHTFVGKYKARRPLGPYEEATRGNAMLVSWSCWNDCCEWPYSVERFRNAPYSYFDGTME